jgi:hypothetical protein
MGNELDLQSACRKLLRSLNIKYYYFGKTKSGFYDMDKNLKGKPDLTFFHKGKTIFVEFKNNEKVLLSESQIEWQQYLLDNNFKYYLIRTYDRFLEVLSENGICII